MTPTNGGVLCYSSTAPKGTIAWHETCFKANGANFFNGTVRAKKTRWGLGLVVNIIVLWNTIYIDDALAQLRWEGHAVRDDEVTRLSPFGHDHINMLGRYSLYPPDQARVGKAPSMR